MARLSVNLNKIALLRNSRHTGVPDPRVFARIAIEAGARGITIHPRPDERHIRRSDVPMLAETLPKTVAPGIDGTSMPVGTGVFVVAAAAGPDAAARGAMTAATPSNTPTDSRALKMRVICLCSPM